MNLKRILSIFLVFAGLALVGCITEDTTEYPVRVAEGEFISIETKGSASYYHYIDTNGEQKSFKNTSS